MSSPLRTILGPELYRQTQLLAGDRGSVDDLVRQALRAYLATAHKEATKGLEQAGQKPDFGPPLNREGPREWRPLLEGHDDFSLQGYTFMLGNPSPSEIRILDRGDGQAIIPISIGVAFLLYLHRAFGVALLERALAPDDFAAILGKKQDPPTPTTQ